MCINLNDKRQNRYFFNNILKMHWHKALNKFQQQKIYIPIPFWIVTQLVASLFYLSISLGKTEVFFLM